METIILGVNELSDDTLWNHILKANTYLAHKVIDEMLINFVCGKWSFVIRWFNYLPLELLLG
jgi:hypothetical protein